MKTNPSIIKWPGGKKQELKIIERYLPKEFQSYYEPFVGGGSCYLNIEAKRYFINDKCDDLINIYKSISDLVFIENLRQFDVIWQEIEIISNSPQILQSYHDNSIQDYILEQINSNVVIQNFTQIENHIFKKELQKRLNSKLKNVSKLNENKEIKNHDIVNNIEASIKSAYYNYQRYLLNHYKTKLSIPEYSSVYFFIRDMAYSGMFRYCKNGNFNVPYGGIGYNTKRFESKIEYFKSDFIKQKLNNTEIFSEDFYNFFKKTNPSKNDFIFLDPPYDTDFSTYSQNIFDKTDQERLANFLINETSAKWMLIIKSTDFIQNLYLKNNLQIIEFDKTYQVSFQGRNDRKCTHLLVTNYEQNF